MDINIQLTTVGVDADNFILYYYIPPGPYVQFDTGVSRAILLAGVNYTIPDNSTEVKIVSTGVCTNELILTISLITTTSTTTILPIITCLDGLIIETIYLNSQSDLDLLPPEYIHPCPAMMGSHNCNRAFFEVYGNGIYMSDSLLNNTSTIGGAFTFSGKQVCTDYLNTPTELVGGGPWFGSIYSRYTKTILTNAQALAIAAAGGGGGTTIDLSFISAMITYGDSCGGNTPHSDVNWLRISTPQGVVLWNSCVEGASIHTIDVCFISTTSTTTTLPSYYGIQVRIGNDLASICSSSFVTVAFMNPPTWGPGTIIYNYDEFGQPTTPIVANYVVYGDQCTLGCQVYDLLGGVVGSETSGNICYIPATLTTSTTEIPTTTSTTTTIP